ncbi:hypothetical protein C8A01DRAFT_16530 [Parachaetomium inaequale]|uniref:Uncharacterized protein n=1 Tax=Parachaetomium inaequale TaxID=2588326 RepID=A0AAN6PEH6_9PEZI|nr:hypothetical protein C8A01DRAFT_16530 [Parachaetomium inaequale]
MAPRHQHTFTLVPNPVGGMQGLMSRNASNALQSDKPPMTSKQAQKLYRESTRGPRLSRAEQRRLEREEQDRIRRELDKEKAANRARALREKKKDKERLAIEEKRRKGLPLVSARPSQDTIARFVRGNGMGKKRDAVGEKVGLPAVREEAEDDRSGAEDQKMFAQTAGANESKRRRLDNGFQDGNHTGTKAVARPEGRDHITVEQGKENRDPKSAPNGVDISDKAVDLLGGKDSAEEPQAPAEEPVDAKNPWETSRPEEKKRTEAKITPAEKTGAEEVKPGAPDSRLSPAGNMARVNPSKAVSEALTKGTPTNPPAIPPVRQRTSPQGVQGQAMAKVAIPKPLPRGLALSPLPKTPINKQEQTPNPPPRSVPPPQQRQNPPKPAPAQQTPARKVLQETTNSSNRIRPVPGTDSASKFASPYKPALATPQRLVPTTGPAFRQPRPQTPAGGLQKPHFLPPHLRSAAARQRPASPASANKPQSRSHDDFLSAPPTSTQLFVMSHIDDGDLFPSPTQEARELRGDPPPAAAGPPKPSHTPSRMPAPVAGFATKSASRPRPLTRQVARVTAPMAPPPCPAVTKPATGKPVAVKPATVTKLNEAVEIPFLISTQDLFFSSQDLRDVEEPTTTPCKIGGTGGNNKPPPFKPRVQQRPSPLSRSLAPKTVQPTAPQSRTKAPAFAGKQLPTAASVTRRPHQACEKGDRCPEQTSVPKNQQTAENNSVPPACPNSPKGKAGPLSVAPLRPPSPEKPRFFSPSGTRAEVFLALGRSRKTHQEEEKRRLAERAGQQGKNNSLGFGQSPGQQEKHLPSKRPETAPGVAKGSAHRHTPPLPQEPRAANSQTESTAQHKAAAPDDQPTALDTASQETDYGDPELDSVDFDDLIITTN